MVGQPGGFVVGRDDEGEGHEGIVRLCGGWASCGWSPGVTKPRPRGEVSLTPDLGAYSFVFEYSRGE